MQMFRKQPFRFVREWIARPRAAQIEDAAKAAKERQMFSKYLKDWTLPDFGASPLDQSDFEIPCSVPELEEQLDRLGVDCSVQEVHAGPTLTSYYLSLSGSTRLRDLAGACDDLSLKLGISTARVGARHPSSPWVALELVNRARTSFSFEQLILDPKWYSSEGRIPMALGLDTRGDLLVFDLAEAPHLLLAGATGSGKSVLLHSLICSILTRRNWQEVQFFFIDLKGVELSAYVGLPHTEAYADKVSDSLSLLGGLIGVMEERYVELARLGVRSAHECTREMTKLDMTPIVLVIDEYADLVLQNKEADTLLARLAAKSRAAGIHIILSTQRPSVKVVTGLVKANFPVRIAGAVPTKTDSRVILDSNGADALIGKGDMLLSVDGKLERFQSAMITHETVAELVDCWRLAGCAHEIVHGYERYARGGPRFPASSDDSSLSYSDDFDFEEDIGL